MVLHSWTSSKLGALQRTAHSGRLVLRVGCLRDCDAHRRRHHWYVVRSEVVVEGGGGVGTGRKGRSARHRSRERRLRRESCGPRLGALKPRRRGGRRGGRRGWRRGGRRRRVPAAARRRVLAEWLMRLVAVNVARIHGARDAAATTPPSPVVSNL